MRRAPLRRCLRQKFRLAAVSRLSFGLLQTPFFLRYAARSTIGDRKIFALGGGTRSLQKRDENTGVDAAYLRGSEWHMAARKVYPEQTHAITREPFVMFPRPMQRHRDRARPRREGDCQLRRVFLCDRIAIAD